jgi:hypothetical protein
VTGGSMSTVVRVRILKEKEIFPTLNYKEASESESGIGI